jgi:subtilisin-like proprotein convertase family protein
MKKIFTVLPIFLILPWFLAGQDTRIAPTKIPLSEIDRLKMPPVDNEALRSAELARRRPGVAPRFAEAMDIAVTPATYGTWERISSAEAVWRLHIISAGAYSLNLGFTRYHMPAGGTMILYSPDRKHVMGPFTPADNEDHAQLWTPVLNGDELVIEVRLPIDKRAEMDLLLSTVNHDFMGFSRLLSGDCNLDVNCGLADGWGIVDRYRDPIHSVAIFGFGGDSFCTGFLINNTREDCTPYFMTANHCQVTSQNAPSVTVYWNFENSRCRQPGNAGGAGDGTLNDYNLGARFLAGWTPSDFTLLELDDPVSSSANAFFAGWSATPAMASDTLTCIHHPSGDEKRITFGFTTTYVGAWGRGSEPVPNGNHLVVPGWDIGTTEVGSSGAPLLNRQGRVIGQLHGGLAACDNYRYDQFGWLHSSWEGGGTPATSLRPWLDPDNTGILELDGNRDRNCRFFFDALEPVQQVCAPETASFEFQVSPNFSIPVILQVLDLPENAEARFSPNPVQPGQFATLVIDNTAAAPAGAYDIRVQASGDSIAITTNILLVLSREQPPSPLPQNPEDGSSEISPFTALTWQAAIEGARYQVQMAGDPDFKNIILQRNDLADPFFQPDLLQPEQDYYWRVKAVNACGESAWSTPVRFRTAGTDCVTRPAGDVPVAISDRGSPTVQSVRTIDEPGTVISVALTNLDIQHTYAGDLKATLTSPGGRSITLFDQIGAPALPFGCDGQDLILSFSDQAIRSAQELENSCQKQPAAQGTFRPLSPLSAFRGEQAAGKWTLTVKDNNNKDGGAILDWNLELCIARPKDLSLKTGGTPFQACPETPFTFELGVGTGFNQNGVFLTASGQPAGAEIHFSKNPALPGDTVSVTLQNLGENPGFPLTITGSDGTDTTALQIDIDVRPTPEATTLLMPSDSAHDIARQSLLRWRPTAYTDNYRLQVATDPEFGKVFFERVVSDTFFIMGGLDFQTTYYWRVASLNTCSTVSRSRTFSFTTVRDASLTTSVSEIAVCAQEMPSFQFRLGSGYENPHLRYRVLPPAPLHLGFDKDTTQLHGGDIVKATLLGLIALPAGTYLIELSVVDESISASETVHLLLSTAPAVPSLLEPAHNADPGTARPQLRWKQTPETDSYLLEISTDEALAGEVRTIQLRDTSYLFPDPLEAGIYYWRVTARNDCGNATTGTRSFRIGTTSFDVLPELNVRLFPNPVGEKLFIAFPQIPPERILLEVFSSGGQLLERRFLSGAVMYQLELSGRPEGLYAVRLISSRGAITRRVVHLER